MKIRKQEWVKSTELVFTDSLSELRFSMQKLEWLNFEAWVSFASFDSIWDLKAEPFNLIRLSPQECKFAVFQIP